MHSYDKKATKQGSLTTNSGVQQNQKDSSGRYLQDNRIKKISQATAATIQKKVNTTGLPDQLKAGVENLSGLSMDDVKVHYNSGKPAQMQAHAFAQGTDIHIASGQEKHLPHEAWHVVQQKQGRVKPTLQMKGVAINDNRSLEQEADQMGKNAINTHKEHSAAKTQATGSKIVQRNYIGDLAKSQQTWRKVRDQTDEATFETLPNYDAGIERRRSDEDAAGLRAWTQNYLTHTNASFHELNLAAHVARFGVRSTLAPSVLAQADVRVRSARVDMPIEAKYSDSPEQTQIDKLIREGHAQLGKSRSSAATGATTWRLSINISNALNPWPYTPSTVDAHPDPSSIELGEAAKGRNLSHGSGLPADHTQIEVISARFKKTFHFAI